MISPLQIQQIAQRIVGLQRTDLETIGDLRERESRLEKQIDELAVGVADILDLLDPLPFGATSGLSSDDHQRVLKKTVRRLKGLFENLGVKEIEVDAVDLPPGRLRVLESRGREQTQLCRRGYVRGDRVVRPAEVIT